MFDLVSGKVERPFQDRKLAPTLVSMAGHLFVATIVAVSLLSVTHELPPVPDMMAFVAPPPLPPPAPPPPAALHQSASAVGHIAIEEMPAPRAIAAPLTAPPAIAQESEAPETTDLSAQDGVEGGVAGGVAGGIVGGLVGGLVGGTLPIASPPPAPSPPAGPVHIGGLIKAPELIHKVQPTYPDLAVAARLGGVVILEATVGADGQVDSVRVLVSQNRLFDRAAIDAVKQWQYSPLVLNGTSVPFVLTVTVNFSVRQSP